MKTLKLVATSALILGLASVNANAWGDKEQGALMGFAAALVAPTMINGFSNQLNSPSQDLRYEQPKAVNYNYNYNYDRREKPRHRAAYKDNRDMQKIIVEDRYGNTTTYFVERGSDTIVIQR